MVEASTTIGLVGSTIRLIGLILRLPRLKLCMVYRWIPDKHRSRSLDKDFDPRRHHHFDLLNDEQQGWVVAVEIENKGRRPITIDDYTFTERRCRGRIFGIIPRYSNGIQAHQESFSDNPRLPIYLQSKQVIYIMEPANRFVPIPGDNQTTEVIAVVYVRRRFFKEARPRKSLSVSHRIMTPSDLNRSIGSMPY